MKKATIIAFLAFILSSFSTSKKIEALIEKEIHATFGIENYTKHVVAIAFEINEKLPIKITEENFFKIKFKEKVLGYYYVGQAFGKADYFDFIVIFDTDLIVSKVKVLVYREDHGGEIRSKRWLKQFSGKSKDAELKYHTDIVGISGATISASAMTNEINKLLKTMHILYNNQQL